MELRDELSATVKRLDPEGRDPALRQMVVIGHSQGGLLTKLTVTDTGDKLWRALSDKPLAELKLTDKQRALLQKAMFVQPLPFVRRVIFISTPGDVGSEKFGTDKMTSPLDSTAIASGVLQ